MCISAISYNLYPCNSKPTSIAATSLLVTAVVAGSLLGVAYGLQWGMGAIATFASVTGVAALVALAIILCTRKSVGERLPYPSQHLPKAFEGNEGVQKPDENGGLALRNAITQQIYTLVKKGDAANFIKALKLYDQEVIPTIYLSADCVLDPGIKTTFSPESPKSKYSILQIILMLEDVHIQHQMLTALLKALKDRSIDSIDQDRRNAIFELYLRIPDPNTRSLLFTKFHVNTVFAFVEYLVSHDKGDASVKFVRHYLSDPGMQNIYPKDSFIYTLIASKLAFIHKLDCLRLFAGSEGITNWTISIHDLHILPSGMGLTGSAPLLLLAVAGKERELMQELLSRPGELANQPFIPNENLGKYTLSPLMLAVLHNDTESVNALLKAKADPNFILKAPSHYKQTVPLICNNKCRAQATQVTPLMIAARMGNQPMVDALLAAGANPDIKDGDDTEAWTMKEYAAEFTSRGYTK
jgi:hypothetical protein